MRFRFTIRDLFWLTLVVAMGVGWWVDHRHVQKQYVSEYYVNWSDPYQCAQILRDIYSDRHDVQFVANRDSVTIITSSLSLKDDLVELMRELDAKPESPVIH